MKYTLIALLILFGCKKDSTKQSVILTSSGSSVEVYANGFNSQCIENRTVSKQMAKGDTFKLKLRTCDFRKDLKVTVKVNGSILYDGTGNNHTIAIPLL